jgi:lipoprotein-anchoring transpeptidase ErfK/SrfK
VSAHRREPERRLRPRVRRIAAASVSTVITSVALMGAVGIIPLGGAGTAATKNLATSVADRVVGAGASEQPDRQSSAQDSDTAKKPSKSTSSTGSTTNKPTVTKGTTASSPTALPASSGSGKRVVFSKGAQRVWLVNAHGMPVSTYLVSGSLTDNLRPGRYQVYSRSRWAVGVSDSGVMQYFVRFAHGPKAAIGFHSIPSKNGTPLQKLSQLGTPQSHGCIRQKIADAERMWDFAKNGTAVVVIA